jgi:hypothetical protein
VPATSPTHSEHRHHSSTPHARAGHDGHARADAATAHHEATSSPASSAASLLSSPAAFAHAASSSASCRPLLLSPANSVQLRDDRRASPSMLLNGAASHPLLATPQPSPFLAILASAAHSSAQHKQQAHAHTQHTMQPRAAAAVATAAAAAGPSSMDLDDSASAADSAASSSSSYSPLASVASLLESSHCLVVDIGRLEQGGSGTQEQYEAVLAMQRAPESDRRASLLAWLPPLAQCGLVDEGACEVLNHNQHKHLHLIFSSRAGLAEAQRLVPALVRCGTLASQLERPAWGDPSHHAFHPCGPPRHKLPELLVFSCLLASSSPPAPEQIQREVDSMLASGPVSVSGAHWWHAKPQPGRLVVNLIPRTNSEEEIKSITARLEKHGCLFSAAVQVHAPHMPSLSRCSECQQLGHEGATCPSYQGAAMRLLFMQPQPLAKMHALRKLVGARGAYLGSGILDTAPHRKITLLFDGEQHRDEQQLAKFSLALSTVLSEFDRTHALKETFRSVNVQHRLTECASCGFVGSSINVRHRGCIVRVVEHSCPFPDPAMQFHLSVRGKGVGQQNQPPSRPQQQPRPPIEGAGKGRPVPSGGAARPSQPNDGMCNSWRYNKVCPHLPRCPFKHPANHVPAIKHCFDHLSAAGCKRAPGRCVFPHLSAKELATQAGEAAETPVVQANPVVGPSLAAPSAAAGAVTAPAARLLVAVDPPPIASVLPTSPSASAATSAAASAASASSAADPSPDAELPWSQSRGGKRRKGSAAASAAAAADEEMQPRTQLAAAAARPSSLASLSSPKKRPRAGAKGADEPAPTAAVFSASAVPPDKPTASPVRTHSMGAGSQGSGSKPHSRSSSTKKV